ncbi:DUF6160 family protein [Pseudomonas sp. TCU-HL1]|uniref:DUF6160 family protein n=1 Tax=Pseudomonas sp. TCU-HL1 TaxID=1856685 RepID=UPI00083E6306|nr:DUF6160 family protein [Pseudomonas sp. TCU-HL1]AOE82815.1 hypothetical protein THL1_267 [Pseudomonas sp. TCU-HL1]
MPRTTNNLRLALACGTALLSGTSQAALESLDNQALSQISGQAGINLRLDVMARIDSIRWTDDGGSLSLRNVRVDNGCIKPGDCPNGSGGSFALGPAQLGLTVPALGADQPTLKLDVVKSASGTQQIRLELPDLTTINEQLQASFIPAQRIRVRVAADMHIGDSRLGSLEIRDITDLRGNFRVWGH